MRTLTDIFSPQQFNLSKKDSLLPAYHQIYSLLKQAILNGTLLLGEQLPAEGELASLFKVSRITAKRALDDLARDSLVQRQRGRGTHIIYDYQPQASPKPLVAMLAELESMGRDTQVSVIECTQLQPPAAIRKEFGMRANDFATHLIRVRSRQGKPFAYYRSWTWGLPAIDEEQWQRNTRLEIFRNNGIALDRMEQILSAKAASDEVAQRLGAEPGMPLLHLIRRSYTNTQSKPRLVDILDIQYHPKRFQYRVDISPNS